MNKTFKYRLECLNQKIADTEALLIDRRIDEKGRTRQVNVCPFLESIDIDEDGVTAKCMISNAGTIRPTEILKLLNLDYSTLSGPIRRYSVRWKMN